MSKRYRFYLGRIIFLLILFCLIVGIIFRSTSHRLSGDISLSDIQSEISIQRNHWGIPRIDADSREDLFFAIGFVHASDRLFQMDLMRRNALGTLSEVFGRITLEQDKKQKKLQIEESINLALKRLPAELSHFMQKYCAGVNSFIERFRPPLEYNLLKHQPHRWTVRDSLAIFKNMEQLLASSGGELHNIRLASVLDNSDFASLVSQAGGETIVKPGDFMPESRDTILASPFRQEVLVDEQLIGSNNWVLSGNKTVSGEPLLANDPHLPNSFPSYFYQISAEIDSFHLRGCTIPGIPLIIIGHNGNIGWGFTNTGTDVIDYFSLKTNPDNSGTYRFDKRWIPFETVKKLIRIKGETSEEFEYKLSRFGPVFFAGKQTLARYSIGNFPSTVVEAFYRMNFAADIKAFVAGLKLMSSPAQNVVFADRAGNIGYFPTGRIPIRARGDGSLPLAGESESDMWQGFVKEDIKPLLLNPERGYIATANNPVLHPGALPLFKKSWNPAFRAGRLHELLGQEKKFSLNDMKRIQLDTFLPGARFLINLLKDIRPGDSESSQIFDRLKEWNYQADGGDEPALFYIFEQSLAENIFLDDVEEAALVQRNWLYKILDFPRGGRFDSEDIGHWVDDANTPEQETMDDMVRKSLKGAVRYLAENGKGTSWDRRHRIRFQHPLGRSLLKILFNRGPYYTSGGRGCLKAASFENISDFSVNHTSTFRLILDFSNIEQSLLINSSGQSGHFLSPNYADQISLYVRNRYRILEDFRHQLKLLRLLPATR